MESLSDFERLSQVVVGRFAGSVPQRYRAVVPAGGQHSAIRGESKGVNIAWRTLEGKSFLRRHGVPEFHRRIDAAGSQRLAVRRKRESMN